MNNYWKGHWIKHPAQINLHGLPADLVTKIMLDFVEISQRSESPPIHNYEDWLRASFGNTFAETFPMEYTIKYHTTTAANMNTDWIGPRLYRPKLEEVLRGALQPSPQDVHYISDFRYPTRGGFVAYLEPFRKIADIKLGHKVVGIDPKARQLRFANGTTADYTRLVSSVPLPELVPMIAGAPPDVLEAAGRLACSEVVIVSLGIDRADLVDAHWTYFYDRDVFFTRLSTPHLQSPHNVPPGCGSLQAECYYSRKYRPLDRRPEDCIEPVIADLKRCGVLRETDRILFRHAMHIPYANVIFDLESAPSAASGPRHTSTRSASAIAAATATGPTSGPTSRSSAARTPRRRCWPDTISPAVSPPRPACSTASPSRAQRRSRPRPARNETACRPATGRRPADGAVLPVRCRRPRCGRGGTGWGS